MSKMNKKIKFALILKNEEEVRTMDELKEQLEKNFDSTIIECFLDGKDESKLAQWLKDHHHQEEAEKINRLWKAYKAQRKNFADNAMITPAILIREIYAVFKLPPPNITDSQSLDINNIEELSKKKDELEDKIDDVDALRHISQVARNQNELDEILKNYSGRKNTKQISIYILSDGAEKYSLKYEYIEQTKLRFVGVDCVNDDKAEIEILKNDNTKWSEEEYKIFSNKKENRNRFSNIIIWLSKPKEESFFDKVNLTKGEDNNKFEDVPQYIKKSDAGSDLFKKGEEDSVEVVKDRLCRYMDASFPLIYLNTFEEDKSDEIITASAAERTVYEWNAEGFFEKTKNGKRSGRWKQWWDLKRTLDFFINEHLLNFQSEKNNITLRRSVLVLKDAHNYLQNDEIVAKLKFLAQLIYNGKVEDCNIIIVSPILKIPTELENYLTILKLGNLTADEIKDLVKEFCDAQQTDCPTGDFLEKLSVALRGLSEFDIINILSLAISSDNELKLSDIDLIRDQKKQMIRKTNVLEMIEVKEELEDIGGLEILKQWLRNKEKIFDNISAAKSFGVKIPKGILIAGMPGCGKSLSAKATAKTFGLPLLRMDMGRIMGKYVGESEANMRRAMQLAEAISPCVLWIDEIEKAFAGIRGDGGGAEVTTRLFGTFLTWMQEKESEVFVVATANNAIQLPPELLRKGRFDEVFYVDLPNAEERRKIFEIHVRKMRGSDWEFLKDDMDEILRETTGFSGADIEGVVREAVEYAFLNDKPNLDKDILKEIVAKTFSISKVQHGPISEMKKLYRKNRLKKASEITANDFDNIAEQWMYHFGKLRQRVKNWLTDFRNRYKNKEKLEEPKSL